MKNNLEQLVRKNIWNLAPYSSARDEYEGKEGVFLDANENPFGTYNRYPDPQQAELKKQLAILKNVSPNQIFLGNGSDEVIDLAFRIFCEPNKHKALTFTPTYGMYEVSANINAVEVIKLPLNAVFQIDRKSLEPYFLDENVKLIFICSPNNPSGNLLQSVDIEYVLENFNGIVIIDEAYIDFCPEATFAAKLNQYPNLIISQTLSKAWGLAGIRLGIAFMSDALLQFFNKVKPPYNISSANQKIALEALLNTTEFELNVKQILFEKAKMIQELQMIKLVKNIYPSDANFLLVEVENANAVYAELVQQKIIIRNRNTVVANCVRITIGTAEENKKLVNALKTMSNG